MLEDEKSNIAVVVKKKKSKHNLPFQFVIEVEKFPGEKEIILKSSDCH